jgi:hypothetical protein
MHQQIGESVPKRSRQMALQAPRTSSMPGGNPHYEAPWLWILSPVLQPHKMRFMRPGESTSDLHLQKRWILTCQTLQAFSWKLRLRIGMFSNSRYFFLPIRLIPEKGFQNALHILIALPPVSQHFMKLQTLDLACTSSFFTVPLIVDRLQIQEIRVHAVYICNPCVLQM